MVEPSPPLDAHIQLSRAIIQTVKQSISDFYAEHPEWWDDPRSRENVDSRMLCARRILALLDNYDIQPKAV